MGPPEECPAAEATDSAVMWAVGLSRGCLVVADGTHSVVLHGRDVRVDEEVPRLGRNQFFGRCLVAAVTLPGNRAETEELGDQKNSCRSYPI